MKPNLPSLSFPKVLDNTTVSTFAKCPRQMFWAHILHLKPKQESIHLHAGKAYALLCEEFRKAYYDPESPTHRDRDESILVALRPYFLAYGFDEEREQSESWQASAKSAHRMLECFFAMLEAYPPATDPIKPFILPNGKPAIEQSFTLELGLLHPDTGEPILFHGRYDMLVEYAGQLFVFDDKTTSALGPRWNDQWDMRSQFTGYVLGAKQYDLPVAGAIVRGHCILKTGFKFAQPITYRKQNQIDDWWNDLHGIVSHMIQTYKKAKEMEAEIGTLATRQYFMGSGTFNDGCNAYSGCAYKQLDQTPTPQRWLSDFEVRIWDPMNPDADVKPAPQKETD